MKAISELDNDQGKINLQARWKNVQNLYNSFWSRWSREYLTTLNQSNKNKIPRQNVKIGQIGIIIDDTKPNQ